MLVLFMLELSFVLLVGEPYPDEDGIHPAVVPDI